MRSLWRFLYANRTLILSIGFLTIFSFGVARATPPTSPYTAGATLDPQCTPGSSNCTVSVATSYTFGTGLTNTSGTITVNASQNISTLSNLISNGLVKTSGGTGALSIATADTDYTTPSGTETFTNKTFDTAGAGNVLKVNGTQITAVTGTGNVVLATSPTLTTPALGVATATSVNGLTLTSNATGFAIAGGTTSKTLTISNTLTLAGTDASTLNIGTGGTLGTAAFTNSTAYQTPLTFSTGLTNTSGTITNNLSVGIAGGQSVIGGTGVTDALSLIGTTGVGTSTSPAIILKVGNNGGTTAVNILNSGLSVFNNGISTTGTASNIASGANFFATGGTATSTTTAANALFGTATTVDYRTAFYGSTSSTLGVNDSYAGVLVASSPITAAATGTHDTVANMVIDPIGTVTNLGATVNQTASLMVYGPSGNNNNPNYGLEVLGGILAVNGNSSGGAPQYNAFQLETEIATFTDLYSAANSTTAFGGSAVTFSNTTYNATNTNVTYTDAATLTIMAAPSAGTNMTITNPMALYVVSGMSALTGGITTNVGNSIGSGANFFSRGTNVVTATATAAALFGGAGVTDYRSGFYGSFSSTLGIGESYANVIVASAPVTTPASGTNAWLTNMAINPIGTVTAGGATVTNTADLYVGAASTAGTNNYSIYSAGGKVNIQGLTASQAVFTDASKNLISVATTGTGNAVLATSPTLTTPALGAATGTGLALTSANTTQTTTSSALSLVGNSLTTGTGLYIASSSLTSGNLADLEVSGTAAAASQTGLNILTTGANATTAITTYGAQISNTHTNATSGTNVALYLNASGATTANYGLIVNSGNVGIGTATPAYPLSVTGNTYLNGQIGIGMTPDTLSSPPFQLGVTSSNNVAEFMTTSVATSATTGKAIALAVTTESFSRSVFYTNGAIGIGPGTATRDTFISRASAGVFEISGAFDNSTNGSLYVTGNIGIGLSPSVPLDISSTATTTNVAQIAANSLTTGNALSVSSSAAGNTNLVSFVSGGTGANTTMLKMQYNGLATLATTNQFVQFLNSTSTQQGAITGTGTTGQVVYTTTSDQRLKHNIQPTTLGLNDLMKISVDDYVFNGDPNSTIVTGFLAQQLQPIFPEAVSATDNGTDALASGAIPWGVDYGRITPLLVKSIQDQQKLLGAFTTKDTPNSTLIADLEKEDPHDPVAIVQSDLQANTSVLTDFLAARVSAIRGYFNEIFAKKVHSNQICLTKSDGSEICVNGDQLQNIVSGNGGGSTTTVVVPPPAPTSTPDTSTTVTTTTTSDTTTTTTTDSTQSAPVTTPTAGTQSPATN